MSTKVEFRMKPTPDAVKRIKEAIALLRDVEEKMDFTMRLTPHDDVYNDYQNELGEIRAEARTLQFKLKKIK